MENGKTLNKEKSSEALTAKGLKLASFEKTETTIPEAAYQLAVAGTG